MSVNKLQKKADVDTVIGILQPCCEQANWVEHELCDASRTHRYPAVSIAWTGASVTYAGPRSCHVDTCLTWQYLMRALHCWINQYCRSSLSFASATAMMSAAMQMWRDSSVHRCWTKAVSIRAGVFLCCNPSQLLPHLAHQLKKYRFWLTNCKRTWSKSMSSVQAVWCEVTVQSCFMTSTHWVVSGILACLIVGSKSTVCTGVMHASSLQTQVRMTMNFHAWGTKHVIARLWRTPASGILAG